MTHAVLPIMRRQRSGRIVDLSSILGLIPAPFSAHCSVAKHAVEGYLESLDHEVRGFGIRVVLVEPGMTRSAFDRNSGRADGSIEDYDAGRASVLGWFSDGMKVADATGDVAKAILIAAETKKPKPRYQTGKGMSRTAILRCLVPAAAFGTSLRRQMRLT